MGVGLRRLFRGPSKVGSAGPEAGRETCPQEVRGDLQKEGSKSTEQKVLLPNPRGSRGKAGRRDPRGALTPGRRALKSQVERGLWSHGVWSRQLASFLEHQPEQPWMVLLERV